MSDTKIISWNINGIRANFKKHTLSKLIEDGDADILCFQEVRCQGNPLTKIIKELQDKHDYPYVYYNCAEKKGYAGTMIMSRIKPLSVINNIGIEKHDKEGRVITAEFEDYFVVTCYTPNSQPGLARVEYRTQEWEVDFLEHIQKLSLKKKVILCGDLNVAHNEIDVYKSKSQKNRDNVPGFSILERYAFEELLGEAKLIDTFRYLNPDKENCYTWWSNLFKARENNRGWRIDYFLCSQELMDNIKESSIMSEYMGSDHAPIKLVLKK